MNTIHVLKSLLCRGGKVGKFLIMERVLGALTRTVDVLMIYFIWTDPKFGALKAFFIGTPLNFALCAFIVYSNDVLVRKGYDITGLEELRQLAHKQYRREQYIRRFTAWMLCRRRTIFLIGSWFYLDPDYVTLLLQDRRDSVWVNILKITLPSVILAMAIWTPLYWSAFQGYQWAVWFAIE